MSNSNSTWDRIERSRESWNVLEHPFYQRWSAGELSADELARYSGQYRHAVCAIADLAEAASTARPEDSELREHAAEESAHIRLWDGFVSEVGGDVEATANLQTSECVAEWTRADGLVGSLAALYAIESGQPPISKTKLEGLRDHYGIENARGTTYFTVHQHRDTEHARQARELIEEMSAPEDADAIVERAQAAFKANWKLLDGVS